jgi:hypothetical protein
MNSPKFFGRRRRKREYGRINDSSLPGTEKPILGRFLGDSSILGDSPILEQGGHHGIWSDA